MAASLQLSSSLPRQRFSPSKVAWFLGLFIFTFFTLFQAGERIEVTYLGELELQEKRPIQVGYAHREYYLFGVAVRVLEGDYYRVRKLNTKDSKGRPMLSTTQREKLTEDQIAQFLQTPALHSDKLPWKVRFAWLYNLFWKTVLFMGLILLYLWVRPDFLRKHRFSVALPEGLTLR